MLEKNHESVNNTDSSNASPASDSQNKERFYAVEILTAARSTILRGCEDFLTNRARINKFRESNPQKAQDAFNELDKTRKKLLEALTNAQQSLRETEQDRLADYAGKLRQGLAGFNLMTRDYAPVNKLLTDFAEKLPETEDSVNAAVDAMKDDGTLNNLIKNYITNFKTSGALPAVAFENFDGADTVKVGVTGDLPPMDLILDDDTPAGFNIAILSEIGKRLQKNIEVVQISTAERAKALISKKIDISFWAIIPTNVAVPLDINKPQGIELSTPYFTDDVVHIDLKK